MNVSPWNWVFGYVAGLTAVVAILAGLLGSFSLFELPFFAGRLHYIAEEVSGPAPTVANNLLLAVYGTVALLYVLLPVGIGSYYVVHGERHPLYYIVFATVAVLGLPSLGLVIVLLGSLTANEPFQLAVVVGSAVILIGAFWVSLERGPVDPDEDIPWAIFANLGLVGLFLIGVVVGSTLAGSAAAGLVEQESATAPPATFEAKYTATEDSGTRGVLTIRHAGGDRIPRDRLYLTGYGFVAVAGVDQIRPGRWQGATSRISASENPLVTRSDTVAVGVRTDCVVRVVYRRGNYEVTIGQFNCASVPVG